MKRDQAHEFVASAEPGFEHTCAVDGCGCLIDDEEHTGGEGIDPPPVKIGVLRRLVREAYVTTIKKT